MPTLRSIAIATFILYGIPAASHAQSSNASGDQYPPNLRGEQVTTAAQPKARTEASIALNEPVLTLHGVCHPPEQPGAGGGKKDCATQVTRQEFDQMMEIASPGAKTSPGVRQNVARMYAELLAFETPARDSGIQDSREFQLTMQLLRLRTLADLYRRNLERQYATPSKEEVDAYYHQESKRFEEVKLRRIVLPKNNFNAASKDEFEKRALEVADELRERAAKGEDVDQLQREGYVKLGFTGPPPATDVGSRRRASLLPEVSDEVFALNPGQVSKVEKEPYSFVIYKIEAKRTLPLEMVRDEVSREISKHKLEDALKLVTGSIKTDLNQDYFGSSGPNDSTKPASLRMK